MNSYDELEDITKSGFEEIDDDEDELDIVKLVSTNANDTSQYLIFEGSNNEFYAKNVSKIEELLVYKDLNLVKNPGEGLIVGTADIRGNMTTIVNFDRWYGNSVLEDNEYELIVLAHYGGHRMGIVVKRVEYIVNIPAETMVDNSETNEKSSFITKIAFAGKERLCTIFDSDKLLLDVFDKIDTQRVSHTKEVKPIVKTNKKILFADDSRFIRKMVQELFDTLNVSYEIYENGKALIDGVKEIPVDEIGLFITDLEMPVMGGRDVMRLIRENKSYNHISIIVHTNMSNDNMESELTKAGANAIIGKVNMLKLGEAINELII
ncbi:chemotaxis protein CheV [Sulfuricurvum sp.]|uniref:chemotaxis protein CheV n=1 Tax=Sulfuricurvum sp. TaxID=2025608 RepID=UPI002E2F8FB5|nr:chemotaxis protein CheV [Sulfuricurvum sp.]HEX5330271.1 chemotaxis protein CheV [Sulfuricurvum sp.]